VHKAFYGEMPEEFRVIEHPDGTQEPIIPGRMVLSRFRSGFSAHLCGLSFECQGAVCRPL